MGDFADIVNAGTRSSNQIVFTYGDGKTDVMGVTSDNLVGLETLQLNRNGLKSISIAAVRRTAQQLCKDEVVTRKKLANFAVTHGATKVPFSFGVLLDGEAVEAGAELDVVFPSPLAPGRKQDLEEVRRQNQSADRRASCRERV